MANRGPTWDQQVHTIDDLKRLGSAKIPKMYRDFFNEGAMDLVTLRDNEEAYNRYKIRPRILVNVSSVDTSSTLFGERISMPLGFAPAATHKLAHPDGEVGTSRAAAKHGIAMGLSSYSTASLEEVAAERRGNPMAMQMCILRDRRITQRVVKRAEAAGYKALFVSVDVPMLGRRLNEYRNSFVLPTDIQLPNIYDEDLPSVMGHVDGEDTSGHEYDDSLDWDSTIPWLRSITNLQIWLKGVTSPEDVALAIRHKLDGVIVSNHGGRQLDGQPATLDALRDCAPVAAGKIPIALDGGIRRGSDIFKAIAMGATAVFVGRIPIWGLAYNGQEGVELALKILEAEFKLTMGLAGCRTVRDITRNHITYLNSEGILAKL